MKKRVLTFVLGITMIISMAFGSIVSLATEGENTGDKKDVNRPEFHISYSTATQNDAADVVEDVDQDIREDIEEKIPDEWEEITISNTEEFLSFAKNCRLDIWSDNKKVVLTNDISLVGTEFSGIPVFGGYFDGRGHTISEVNLYGEMSYAGLFSRIVKNGVVKDLKVTGTVMPSGNPIHVGGICADNEGTIINCNFKGVVYGNDYVGMICAMNELTGIIADCQSEGFVKGNHFVGGIAGENMGNIMSCINEALINTTNTDTQMTIDAMSNISKVISFIKNGENRTESANADTTAADVGGICGQSIGIIYRSLNNGDVGYEHVGYNIGGIVGRQSGYILSCTNNGNILGRKDVGGITGQAEPYITVDLSSDIAYQLSEAISKLHDIITVTLKDAKAQSDTITSRLSIIQQFTKGAIEDVRYLADGTIDFANGVTGAASTAFNRIDYVLEESSKNDGLMDQITYASDDTRKSADELRETIKDLNIEQYMEADEKADYDTYKNRIEVATSTYTELVASGERAYYNKYISKNKSSSANTDDLTYSGDTDLTESFDGNKDHADFTISDKTEIVRIYNKPGDWTHNNDGASFPVTDENDTARFNDDKTLAEEAARDASAKAVTYADEKYLSATGNTYSGEIADATTQMTRIIYAAMQRMEKVARADALKTVSSIEDATDHIYNAGGEAKRIIKSVADADNISFPQLGADYRAHTTSLTNNLQGVNDNFGLLNGEVNNATGVLVDDLQAMADQFNVIMLLYTDAVDGVLEMDYTANIEDVSLAEAADTMDATIDSCLNYGEINGDISVSGIAGTMAIDYDFDQEGDVTGIKDSKLNSSYITKCVLRNNKNYGEITGVKSNVGGICGLQEMGTVLSSGSYANVTSTSGENVGGVVGSSLGYIVSSFSRGILKGSDYVGGVVGNGMHIRNCFSLVSIEDAVSWYGAIAGHVDDKGEVRNNFFVSDTLDGIDRTSYALKAEPVSYDEAVSRNLFLPEEGDNSDEKETENIQERSIPREFDRLSVTFVLNDDDLENGEKIIQKIDRKYGEKLEATDYPEIDEKDGFYVTWDKPEIEELQTDETITASYTRYLTTISDKENSDDDFYQSDILVDGMFKEGDAITVNRTFYDMTEDVVKQQLRDKDQDVAQDVVKLEVEIPEDGSSKHQIRFKPDPASYKYTDDNYIVYQMIGDERVPLTQTGKMGKYRTYEIEGNEFTLVVGLEGFHVPFAKMRVYIIVAIIVLLIIIITIILIIKAHGKKLSQAVKGIREGVQEKIESKEQIFYNDEEETKKSEEKKPEDK